MSDATSEASSSSSNKIKPEVATFDFRSAAMMDCTDGADSTVASTGSDCDDVTVPEVNWSMTESSSPDHLYPVSALPHQSGVAKWWPAGLMTYPSPDPVQSSQSVKPEVVDFDFRSAAVMGWTDEAEQSLVSTGSYADNVTVPQATSDMMVSRSPHSRKPGATEWHPIGLTTYPSPDPVPETEPIAFDGPFCIYSEWLPTYGPIASPNDQWLDASDSVSYTHLTLPTILRV